MKENPLSKRAIIDLWDASQRDVDKPTQCLIYMSFRNTNEGLQMSAHLRANTADDKALMNFHTFAAFHRYIAGELGLKVAGYYHFADSYHLKK